MKMFLKKVALYLILLLGFLVFCEWSFSRIVRVITDCKVSPDFSFLILGHSHAECTFNDTYIEKSINFAKSGESYFYTYHKTKILLQHNPHIQCALIEFTNNQVNKRMDIWTWGKGFMTNRYGIYAPFMPLQAKYFLFIHNPSEFANSYLNTIKINGFKILTRKWTKIRDWGGFFPIAHSKVESILENNNLELPNKQSSVDIHSISKVNLRYLDSLILLLKERNVKPILIRSPQHKFYGNFANEATYQYCLLERYSDIPYFDFTDFPLQDTQFADLEHLNTNGAQLVSSWLNSLLKKGMMNSDNPSNFFYEELQKLSSQ